MSLRGQHGAVTHHRRNADYRLVGYAPRFICGVLTAVEWRR